MLPFLSQKKKKSSQFASKGYYKMVEDPVKQIIESHKPPLEPEVREYLEGFLDDVDGQDEEDLLMTLSEFLGEQDSKAIVDIIVLSNRSSASPKNDNNGPVKELLPLPLKQIGTPMETTGTTRTVSPEPRASQQQRPSSPTKGEEEENESSKSPPTTTTPDKKSKFAKRKENRMQKQKRGKKGKSQQEQEQESEKSASPPELLDDHASAWKDCQEEGKLWGGRGHGGRGVRYTGDNLQNIHLPSVSLQFAGNELLVDSPMDIVRGHRYGLLGRNGVGKSTLLKQLAAGSIPGIPQSMRILLVQQQIQGRTDQTTIEALVSADLDRLALLEEQMQVEASLEAGNDVEANAERLGDIVAELDAIDADGAEDRALKILKGLSFTNDMIRSPTASLSGGWRMRLALAQALFVPHSDLILLDECTNHLDLHGMNWLVNYINTHEEHTLIVVSHDRAFLDAICTDIIVMEHQQLRYHVGSYSEYQRQVQEKMARDAQVLDASEKQRSKAMAFIQKQQNSKKSTDPNKQRQAKMMKEKKLDRIGNFRDDGKRYKQFSMKTMSEDSVRLAQKVHIERDDPVIKMKFPNPTWPPGVSESGPIIKLEDACFGYNKDSEHLLRDLTLQISRGSKVALVGSNGAGKTTLIKLITGGLDKIGKISGEVWRHPSVRIGHVTQYAVEELEECALMTVVEYAEKKLSGGKASSSIISGASGNVRQYLGAFGLGGEHAHRLIGKLSGGERMRLCFATVLSDEPHILFLDESTNHVDLETLDSMSAALKDFEGAVLMVSHNQAFLSGFCEELWVLENGAVDVRHNDTASFDELFSQYRNSILSASGASTRSHVRRTKADMAKRANKQTATTKQAATLLT